jgi:Uma2 family endonuclease
MSTVYSTFVGPPGVGPIQLPVSPLSTAKFLGMIDAGLLGSEDKVELIAGVMTELAPAGPEHGGSIINCTRLFAPLLVQFELATRVTLVVSEGNVYDPDFMLLRRRPEGYRHALPRTEDVALVIESAASSMDRDRHVKLPAYATAGIAEYWIADVDKMALHVFRDPASSTYKSEQTLSGDDRIAPLCRSEYAIRVGDIFA